VTELAGEQVRLRPLGLDDVAAVAAIQAEPSVARWWGEPDVDDLARKARGEDEATAFAITVGTDLVGLIQYYENDDPDFRYAGIDLFVTTNVQGRGAGTDAVRTLARHLIHDRGHHRLVIDPAAANQAAIRAYEKVGFRRVGVLRKYWRAPDGTWQDGLLLDLLAEELR
jgi:aminoglycoside 6'-N-acetyltransferase